MFWRTTHSAICSAVLAAVLVSGTAYAADTPQKSSSRSKIRTKLFTKTQPSSNNSRSVLFKQSSSKQSSSKQTSSKQTSSKQRSGLTTPRISVPNRSTSPPRASRSRSSNSGTRGLTINGLSNSRSLPTSRINTRRTPGSTRPNVTIPNLTIPGLSRRDFNDRHLRPYSPTDRPALNIPQLNFQPQLQRPPRNLLDRIAAGNLDALKQPGTNRTSRLSQLRDIMQQDVMQNIVRGKKAQLLKLKDQYRLFDKGDVARRAGLLKHAHHHHGLGGLLSGLYIDIHFHWGGGCSPHWSPWVDWCWWDHCWDWCDPRPPILRPHICHPCPVWVYYPCPTWHTLPVVHCGTWVDVPLAVTPQQDLQLLAVRIVDHGHPEQQLGPRYRVWVRNNSQYDLNVPFNVMALASNTPVLDGNGLGNGVQLDGIQSGQIRTVDIRLPYGVYDMQQVGTETGQYSHLHVIVDSHRMIDEFDERNNGVALAASQILLVDPAVFAADREQVSAGQSVSLAGEGLGSEPGEVLVYLNDMPFQAEIEGWYDLGVRVKLPALPIAQAMHVQVIIVRRDGATAQPLDLVLSPAVAATVSQR